VIKALAVRPGFERQVSGFVNAGVDRFLLDSGSGGLRGGTGKTFNVSDAADFVRNYRTIVAGGLTPENIGQVIREYHPWGVDVVSGVERQPGKKDNRKLRAFIESVREADQERVAAKL
jgi:phosphoribosylanthranilate isomerase